MSNHNIVRVTACHILMKQFIVCLRNYFCSFPYEDNLHDSWRLISLMNTILLRRLEFAKRMHQKGKLKQDLPNTQYKLSAENIQLASRLGRDKNVCMLVVLRYY